MPPPLKPTGVAQTTAMKDSAITRRSVEGEGGAERSPWYPSTPRPPIVKVDTGPVGLSRLEEKQAREKKALEEAAASALAAVGGGGGVSSEAARAAAMESARKAIQKLKESNKGARLSEAPSLVRLALEVERYKHNAQLHKDITFQHRVNERRERLERGCGSKAERDRMLSNHAAEREESRREILRGSIRQEILMLDAIKKAGVRSFAGLADAWG